MCGTYYVDDEMEDEIEKVIRNLDRDMSTGTVAADIRPSMSAPVLTSGVDRTLLRSMKWGFSMEEKGRLLINARSESAMTKPTFRSLIPKGTCVIPSRGFYEWDHGKHKFTFSRPDKELCYMAGLYRYQSEVPVFTILTTAANASMSDIHPRMPLVLESGEVMEWLNGDRPHDLLKKTPLLLDRTGDYEQLSFDFI